VLAFTGCDNQIGKAGRTLLAPNSAEGQKQVQGSYQEVFDTHFRERCANPVCLVQRDLVLSPMGATQAEIQKQKL
jgi:hypothetical protein